MTNDKNNAKNKANAAENNAAEIAAPRTVIVHGQEIELKRDFVNPFAEKTKKQATGVIATIAALCENAENGITKGEVLEILANVFPDRNVKSMASTVNVQLPTRLASDKQFTFVTTVNAQGEKVYTFAGIANE